MDILSDISDAVSGAISSLSGDSGGFSTGVYSGMSVPTLSIPTGGFDFSGIDLGYTFPIPTPEPITAIVEPTLPPVLDDALDLGTLPLPPGEYDLSGLTEQLSGLSGQISGLTTQVSGLQARLTDIEFGLGTGFSVLSEQVETGYSSIGTEISGLGTQISTGFAGMGEQLGGLGEQLTAGISGLSTQLGEGFTGLSQMFSGLTERLSGIMGMPSNILKWALIIGGAAAVIGVGYYLFRRRSPSIVDNYLGFIPKKAKVGKARGRTRIRTKYGTFEQTGVAKGVKVGD